jgi:hypothetical protein
MGKRPRGFWILALAICGCGTGAGGTAPGPMDSSGGAGAGTGGGAGAGAETSGGRGGSAGAETPSDARDEDVAEAGPPPSSGDTAAASDAAGVSGDGGASPSSGAPLLPILERFTAPGVPAMGPKEAPPPARPWPVPTVMPMLPGMGLGQHPMLYAGEGYNGLFVVNHGKVVWTYALGAPGEIDDVWMLSNGDVLVCFDQSVLEISPNKEVVWSYLPPPPAQVHSCQPLGLDRVLLMQNDLPPKVIVINKATNAVEQSRPLPPPGGVDAGAIHTQFRRFRLTAAGTYLAAWLKLDKVVEYDKDLKIIWTYAITNPWSAIRLRNGNTLITSESARMVREVGPQGDTVWEWKQSSDLPAGLVQQNTQSAERLDNGNTVIFASRSPQSATQPNVQAIEVTREKKVVWVLQDWKNLGQATTAQFLDQPGIPEVPGDLVH